MGIRTETLARMAARNNMPNLTEQQKEDVAELLTQVIYEGDDPEERKALKKHILETGDRRDMGKAFFGANSQGRGEYEQHLKRNDIDIIRNKQLQRHFANITVK